MPHCRPSRQIDLSDAVALHLGLIGDSLVLPSIRQGRAGIGDAECRPLSRMAAGFCLCVGAVATDGDETRCGYRRQCRRDRSLVSCLIEGVRPKRGKRPNTGAPARREPGWLPHVHNGESAGSSLQPFAACDNGDNASDFELRPVLLSAGQFHCRACDGQRASTRRIFAVVYRQSHTRRCFFIVFNNKNERATAGPPVARRLAASPACRCPASCRPFGRTNPISWAMHHPAAGPRADWRDALTFARLGRTKPIWARAPVFRPSPCPL